MTLPANISTTNSSSSSTSCCPSCGISLPSSSSLTTSDAHAALQAAQRQIADLEAQVRLLNQKATAAVDRWADYEDELHRLRTASAATTVAAQTHTPAPSLPTSSPRSSFLPAGAASRISQLLSPRKSVPNFLSATAQSRASMSSPALPISPSSPSPSTDDLLEALNREQSLRKAAEGKLDETSREVEELSVSLFEQANEMVASERRARAKLEERVGVLERRDEEKKGRLERLEGAVGRIERVGRLLGD